MITTCTSRERREHIEMEEAVAKGQKRPSQAQQVAQPRGTQREMAGKGSFHTNTLPWWASENKWLSSVSCFPGWLNQCAQRGRPLFAESPTACTPCSQYWSVRERAKGTRGQNYLNLSRLSCGHLGETKSTAQRLTAKILSPRFGS